MISLKEKFIFIHIPRTAGTSVELALSPYSEDIVIPPDGQSGGELHPKGIMKALMGMVNPGRYKHSRAIDFKKALKKEYDDYYKFVFVRHPIDKLFSLKRFNECDPKAECSRYSSLSEEDKSDWWKSDRWSLFMREYFCDENGAVIVDDIFKFENLNEDWKTACNKMGIKHAPLPHYNDKKGKKFTEFLNDKDIKFFEDFYREEMKALGYGFALDSYGGADKHL